MLRFFGHTKRTTRYNYDFRTYQSVTLGVLIDFYFNTLSEQQLLHSHNASYVNDYSRFNVALFCTFSNDRVFCVRRYARCPIIHPKKFVRLNAPPPPGAPGGGGSSPDIRNFTPKFSIFLHETFVRLNAPAEFVRLNAPLSFWGGAFTFTIVKKNFFKENLKKIPY